MRELLSRQYAEPLFKLVSRRNTLLGTITIPHHWAEALDRQTYFQFQVTQPFTVQGLLEDVPEHVSSIKFGALSCRIYGEYRGALELHGLTPEEFEKLPGCTFQPGAGYIRSLIGKD